MTMPLSAIRVWSLEVAETTRVVAGVSTSATTNASAADVVSSLIDWLPMELIVGASLTGVIATSNVSVVVVVPS